MNLFLKSFLFFLLPFLNSPPQDEFLRQKVEMISSGIPVTIQGEAIYCKTTLPAFYQENQFLKAWNEQNTKQLISVLENADDEGLNSANYHLSVIKDLRIRNKDSIEEAELDLLLTDAFLLYSSHLLNGKVNPETVDSEWQAIRREGDAKAVLIEALKSNDISDALKDLAPDHVGYKGLKNALKEYRNIVKNGGWEEIPSGETLKPGMTDSVRVPLLINRLQKTFDLNKNFSKSYSYSDQLAEAVRKYQVRNGLESDGNLGKLTTASLNITAEKRVEQIITNMERYRWAAEEMGDHYVIVNIADYQLQVYNNRKKTFEEKVIVGKPFRKTPVFSSKMSYLVFNPTWTVPPTILFNDMLPELKKDPGYAKSKNIRVLQGQGSNAVEVDPYVLDWSSLSKTNFPYTLRQDSGPPNALGIVKFMFPNKYNVYIHDTPSKELFNKTDRAFSSGCIRVNNPLKLAEYILKEQQGWNKDKIDQTIKDGKEQSVILKQPFPVHILYLTSWASEGQVHFRNDLYDRDAAVIKSLNSTPPSI
ncbi:Murein L,D-transpeptidase YcbB/YkuD [Ekhidna lutea]|uniref:Murein L,D-transpeptidase YcbB/YkuD n=1 Tax=Ekhidna lutea TaxID=447679 RepID=A0A239F7X0_EKHLU|nr:L,D-transpeptidase family protein [Ekhidna lutea]SNS52897.1 Murein L,D-transpeptidase YcbB/YkuD [Ekhidna lutea]